MGSLVQTVGQRAERAGRWRNKYGDFDPYTASDSSAQVVLAKDVGLKPPVPGGWGTLQSLSSVVDGDDACAAARPDSMSALATLGQTFERHVRLTTTPSPPL